MAKRKIVSQTDDTTQAFPSLNFPISKVLTEDMTFEGVEYKAGQTDPSYVNGEIEYIPLVVIGTRKYYSVHGGYTAVMLKPTEQNDYVIETALDGNFTNTVLIHNHGVESKYKEDPTYLEWLGLPAYDPKTHTLDLESVENVPAEIRAAADARWEANLAEKRAWFESKGLEFTVDENGAPNPGEPPTYIFGVPAESQ